MRQPYIKYNRFSKTAITKLCHEFSKQIKLDFHLMTFEPLELIKDIDKLIGQPKNKKDINITIHREIGEIKLVYQTLKYIKSFGYHVGLALEPASLLESVSDEIIKSINLMLLMTVKSGKGGQKFDKLVLPKIKSAHKDFPKLEIQVDGGINSEILPKAI